LQSETYLHIQLHIATQKEVMAMTRQSRTLFVSFLFAFALSGAAAGPALASGVHYRAEPASPPATERLVVRDVVWKCGAAGCVAGKSNSRANVECAALARQVGTLRTFSAGGQALPADQLEKCNARAR
jgi:hypothetical protein